MTTLMVSKCRTGGWHLASRMRDSNEDSMSTQPRSATPLISTRIDSPHSVREVPVGSRDAARLLRMHPKTVLRKAREGALPAHPVGRDRKRWHFYLSELDDWLRSQVIEGGLVRQ
jgi:excisionase family DNA binding protein